MNPQDAAKTDLIKELGIENLPKEKQEEILERMGEVMQQRIILRLIEEMPEAEKEEFVTLLDQKKGDPALVENFLREKVPNIDAMVAEEIGRYKQELMEVMDQSMGEAEQK